MYSTNVLYHKSCIVVTYDVGLQNSSCLVVVIIVLLASLGDGVGVPVIYLILICQYSPTTPGWKRWFWIFI